MWATYRTHDMQWMIKVVITEYALTECCLVISFAEFPTFVVLRNANKLNMLIDNFFYFSMNYILLKIVLCTKLHR